LKANNIFLKKLFYHKGAKPQREIAYAILSEFFLPRSRKGVLNFLLNLLKKKRREEKSLKRFKRTSF
jgi:hypothetical protein